MFEAWDDFLAEMKKGVMREPESFSKTSDEMKQSGSRFDSTTPSTDNDDDDDQWTRQSRSQKSLRMKCRAGAR